MHHQILLTTILSENIEENKSTKVKFEQINSVEEEENRTDCPDCDQEFTCQHFERQKLKFHDALKKEKRIFNGDLVSTTIPRA